MIKYHTVYKPVTDMWSLVDAKGNELVSIPAESMMWVMGHRDSVYDDPADMPVHRRHDVAFGWLLAHYFKSSRMG